MVDVTLDIYAENLVENYERPHNKRILDNASISMHEDNPSCGDEITVYLKIEDGKVADVGFDGDGCAISMGSASMMTDFIKGKSLAEIEKMGKDTVVGVIGVDPGIARMHCATLSLRAIKDAVYSFEKKKPDAGNKEL